VFSVLKRFGKKPNAEIAEKNESAEKPKVRKNTGLI